MMIKPLIMLFAGTVAAIGCSGNPTNEPSAADVLKANEARAAAIDNDPTFTPQQKEQMKAAMGLNGSKSR